MMSSTGVGTSVPSSSIKKNGTKVPTPEGYKQTKVGVIPEDWDTPCIDTVLQRIRKKVDVEKETLYQQIGIRSHAKGIFHKELVTGEALGNKSVFWVEEDCFIVNIVFAWEQAVAKTTKNEKGMIASHRFPMYQPKDNKSDIDYILYFFKSKRGKYLLGLASPGGAGRNKTLGQGEFSKLKIPLPPLNEQQKIAQILTTWDDAISKQEALIKAKEELKKGLMQKLLSGEVRFGEFGAGTSVPSSSREKNGTEVPAPKWEILELSNIFDIASKKLNPKLSTENKKCIELEHIEQKSGKLLGYTDSEEQQSTKNIFQEGQILYGKLRPYLRKYWKTEFDGVCSSEIWVLNNSKKITNEYLFYFIQTEKFNQIANISSGSKMPRSDWKYMADIPFDIPSLKEQQKIAKVLTLADKEINLLKNELEVLKEQKRGLMQRLLSGEVRVLV